MIMTTNVPVFFTELDGGVFERKLSSVLTDVGAAVIEHGKGGEVTIKLKLSQIGNSHQVSIEHILSFARPTLRGKRTEEDKTVTPMYVGTSGLTLFPENQSQMFTKTGDVVEPGTQRA